jgi:hypothetical protein
LELIGFEILDLINRVTRLVSEKIAKKSSLNILWIIFIVEKVAEIFRLFLAFSKNCPNYIKTDPIGENLPNLVTLELNNNESSIRLTLQGTIQ